MEITPVIIGADLSYYVLICLAATVQVLAPGGSAGRHRSGCCGMRTIHPLKFNGISYMAVLTVGCKGHTLGGNGIGGGL